MKSVLEGQSVKISRTELRELRNQVLEMFKWCSGPNAIEGVCKRFFELIRSFLNTLHQSRALWQGVEESVDSDFLSMLSNSLKRFWLYALGAIQDDEMRVYVEILESFELGGRVYPRGYNTFMHLEQAVLLSILGFVKVVPIPLLLEKIRL